MDKYNIGTSNTSYFCEVSYIYLNLITCNDKIGIPLILQSYALYWYHAYLLHPGMNRTVAMILQHFYCPGIIKAVQKEVNNHDTCQSTKQ